MADKIIKKPVRSYLLKKNIPVSVKTWWIIQNPRLGVQPSRLALPSISSFSRCWCWTVDFLGLRIDRTRSQQLGETVQDFCWCAFTQVPLSTKAFLFLYSMKRRGFKVKEKKRVCSFLFYTAAQSGYLEEDNSPNDYSPPLVPIGCCQAQQQEIWGELSL